jgi:hypothetical protein
MKQPHPETLGFSNGILLMLAALSTSCGYPRDIPVNTPPPAASVTTVATVAPEHAKIDLRLTFVALVDARVRVACEAGINSVLRHHGFLLEPTGTRVALDVVLVYDPSTNAPFGDPEPGQGVWNINAPPSSPADASSTADLTAKIGRDGEPQKVVRTAGTGHGLACAAAAERLAAGLADALGRP